MTCSNLQGKLGRTHKWRSPMDPFTWTRQCWPTNKNLPTTALYGPRMLSWRRSGSDGWKRLITRESAKSARRNDDDDDDCGLKYTDYIPRRCIRISPYFREREISIKQSTSSLVDCVTCNVWYPRIFEWRWLESKWVVSRTFILLHGHIDIIVPSLFGLVWFGVVPSFYGISNFVGYLMLKPSI